MGAEEKNTTRKGLEFDGICGTGSSIIHLPGVQLLTLSIIGSMDLKNQKRFICSSAY